MAAFAIARQALQMAPPRIQAIGETYHVNGKAVHGTKLFVDESDRFLFLRMLEEQMRKSDWCVLAYSLMTTHYHLLLRLRGPTLSSGFHRFNSIYARAYNRRHGRRGALWQRRFFDSIVSVEGHLYESIRYVALNAPRANVCGRPEDWPWCSYGAAIGHVRPDPLVDERALLELFGTRRDQAIRRLRAYIEEADPRVRFGQTRV
jgi:REP element-mobilizing transposase RayT